MANRRKFIAGLGALATGSAAAVGTGAFTAVQADRSIAVNVATDANSFLGIEVADSDRASQTDGEINLDFETGENDTLRGLNPDARTFFADVLRVTNRGENDVYLSVDDSNVDGSEDGSGLQGIKRMTVYMNDDSPTDPSVSPRPSGETRIDFTQEEGGNAPLDFSVTPPKVRRDDSNAKLSPGESALLSFVFITNDNPPTGSDLADKSITVGAASPATADDSLGI